VTHADPPRLVSPRARPSGSCRYLWGSEPLPSIDIGGAATLGWHLLTWPLVVVAAVAYVVLWVLNGLRLVRYPDRVLAA